MVPFAHSSSSNDLLAFTQGLQPTTAPSVVSQSPTIAQSPLIWQMKVSEHKMASIKGRGIASVKHGKPLGLLQEFEAGSVWSEGSAASVEFPPKKDANTILETPFLIAIIHQLAWPLVVFSLSMIYLLSTYVQLYQTSQWRLSRVAQRLRRPAKATAPTAVSSSPAQSNAAAPLIPPSISKLPLVREISAEALKSGLYWYGLGNVCDRQKDDGASSPYFDPARPSVIYVHGFQPRTIIRQFRETFNWKENDPQFGLDVDAADAWLNAGWNVGVFYWNQFADEAYIHDAEAKIWTNASAVGMRYRVLSRDGKTVRCRYKHNATETENRATVPCVSRQLASILQQRFPKESAPYRLVGHSLGSQVVIHGTKLLSQEQQAQGGAFQLPSNIALLDVFFTFEPKRFLGWRTVGSVLAGEIEALTEQSHIVVEQYKTSVLSHIASQLLRPVTDFFELDIPHIPWYKLRSRHIAAPYLYFISVAAMLKWLEA